MPQQPLQIDGLTPEQTQAWIQSLMQRESSGINQDNDFGYTGLFQFGSDALVSVGLVDEAKNRAAKAKLKRPKDWYNGPQKTFLADPDNWTIKGGKETFWGSRELQEKAAVEYANQNLKGLRSFTKGDPAKISGYSQVAHLNGLGAARALAAKGIDSRDGRGTKSSSYFTTGQAAINNTNVDAIPKTQYASPIENKPETIVKKDGETSRSVFDQYKPTPVDRPTDVSPNTTLAAPNTNAKPYEESNINVPPTAPEITAPPKVETQTTPKVELPSLEQMQNLRNLSGEDILYGSPKDATIESNLSTDKGTFTPEDSQEAVVLKEIQNLPEKLRTTLANNMASLASAKVNQPRNYQDVYSPETQKMMENLINQTGVLNG